MHRFILIRPKTISCKRNGIVRDELIEELHVQPLVGDADDVERAARTALVNGGTHPDGRAISAGELDQLDVSGAIRDAYRDALNRARGSLPQ
jgi:hypothetical protein